MFKVWGFRLIIHRALLIALMSQGMTPDANTLVSSLILDWLHANVVAGGQDPHHPRMPDSDRSAPSDGPENQGTPDEVVVSSESIGRSVLNLHQSKRPRFPFTATNLSGYTARRDPWLLQVSRRRNEPVNDLTPYLCKLTC